MLAQAQECILEKSMTDSRKSTITAKVAAQIVDFYNTALKHLETCNQLELISSKQYKEWKKKIDIKMLFYTCITHYYMGRQSEDQQKWGQCLAYYTLALEKLTECEKLAKNESTDIQDSLRFTHDVVGGKHQSAKKDNDFVYHEKVPAADTLPEVKGASLVKGIPFNPNDPEISGPDIFNKLVPMSAHEAASLYSEEKATLLRRIASEIAERNDELNQYLASLQLDQTTLNPEPERLPQQLLEKCAALSVRPTAIKELVDSMTAVSSVSTDVEMGIRDIQETLQEESTAELEFQDMFGKRNPNAILSEIAQECSRLEEGHKKASQSNVNLHTAMNTHINNLKLLASPLEELQKLLPSLDQERGPESGDIIKQLNLLLSKIEEMRTQRQSLEDELRKSILEDDITGALCKQEGVNREKLFSEQLQKHDKNVSLIKQNLSAQGNILRALTDANAKYATVRRATSDALSRREQVIRDLINSYDVYEDLKTKSQKGLDFYRKLETNVGRLLQRCKNVCRVQHDERQKMYDKYKPKAPAPVRPQIQKPTTVQGSKPSTGDMPDSVYSLGSTQPPVSSLPGDTTLPHVAAMFDGPKLKDYLPFMKPKTFGKKDGSPPVTGTHPSVQGYLASQSGSLPPSGTASPIHMPQLPDSVPASPDHHRFDRRLGPTDPRQPGPDLTQGHLYRPVSPAGQGQMRGQGGQSDFMPERRHSPSPGAGSYGGSGPQGQMPQYQGQMPSNLGKMPPSQGRMPQNQGHMPQNQGQMPPNLSDQYVPLDQKWKREKPVQPQQQSFPIDNQYVSNMQPGQGQNGVMPQQPGNQSVTSLAQQRMRHLQPMQVPGNNATQGQNNQNQFLGSEGNFMPQGHAQGQNIPYSSQSYHTSAPTSAYMPQQVPPQAQTITQFSGVEQPMGSISGGHMTSLPSQMPPQSMAYTNQRDVTNTVYAVGGPLTSSDSNFRPGMAGQNYQSHPSQGMQGQINQQALHQDQGYSQGQYQPPMSAPQTSMYQMPQSQYQTPSLAGSNQPVQPSSQPQHSAVHSFPFQQPNQASQFSQGQGFQTQQQGQGQQQNGGQTTNPMGSQVPSQYGPAGSITSSQPSVYGQSSYTPQGQGHSQQVPSHGQQQTFTGQQQGQGFPQQNLTSQRQTPSPHIHGQVSQTSVAQPSQYVPNNQQMQQQPPANQFQQPTSSQQFLSSQYQQVRPQAPPNQQAQFSSQGVPSHVQSQHLPEQRFPSPAPTPTHHGQGQGYMPPGPQGQMQGPQMQNLQGMKGYIPPNSQQSQFSVAQSSRPQGYIQGQGQGQIATSQQNYGQGQFSQSQINQPQRPPAPNYSETNINRAMSQQIGHGQIRPMGQSPVPQPVQGQLPGINQTQAPGVQQIQPTSQTPIPGQQQTFQGQSYQQSVGGGPQIRPQMPASQFQQIAHPTQQPQMSYQQPGVRPPASQGQGYQPSVPQGQTLHNQPVQRHPTPNVMNLNQPVLQPQIVRTLTPSEGPSPATPVQGQGQIPQVQGQVPQQLPSSQAVGPSRSALPIQPQGQMKQNYQPESQGNFPQGQGPTMVTQSSLPPRGVSPVEMKPAPPAQPYQPPKPPSTPVRTIPTNRQLSTASSLDEILSSSPDARPDNRDSLLAPKVMTAQDLQQQKEDQMKASHMPVQPHDPYKERSKRDKFVDEVEKLAKFIDCLEKPSCSGPTPLDTIWKELMEEQEKASRHQKLAIARCYPMKNRDQDIMPYDNTRILLTTLQDDYVNASWVNDLSPTCPKFIATQAPLPVTLTDFWLMVCEQGVEVLVALSSDIETGKKFPVYFPDEKGETMEHGPVQLTVQSVKKKPFWTERILYLKHHETNTGRTLVHLHYNAWPVSGFPDKVSHLLQFITEVHSFYRQQRSLMKPIVIHCSNGVGRTGMFQLIYVGMQEINHGHGIVNIPEVAGKLLWKRRNLLLKQDQLKFCYTAILYYAQDVLAKEGILVHKASFGDQLPKPGVKPQGWEPGEDILFGSLSFTNLQSNVAKLSTRKPVQTGSEIKLTNQSGLLEKNQERNTLDEKLAALKLGTDENEEIQQITGGFSESVELMNTGNQLTSSLPDVVQNPGLTLERKHDIVLERHDQAPEQISLDTAKGQGQKGDLLSDLDSLVAEMKGSRTPSIHSMDSMNSKGSKSSSVTASPAHVSRDISQSPKLGRDFSQSPKPEMLSSSLAELQDPTKFTIGTNEGSKKKIKKTDFTDPNRQPAERDPNDPLSSLDPFWTVK
ncbi:tyrosine-protein phosphatase non-receptor type 23-like isoform X2 [Mya arenaria]|nr:tyrosine-protein phosphatase non-receptor type 23-like isoform X2 [Mya arenaria]